MKMKNFAEFTNHFSKKAGRLIQRSIGVFLVLAFCLSAAGQPTPISAKSPGKDLERPPQARLNEDIPCSAGLSVISTDTTWMSGTVYNINNCVVIVNAGITLTVEGGAEARFSGTTSGIKVLGTLNAAGSSGNLALFRSVPETAGSWYGIYLAPGSTGNFDYAAIRGAGAYVANGNLNGYNRAQLDVVNATLNMDHSEITNGNTSGIYLQGASLSPTIQNTSVSSNLGTGNQYGYAIYQATINMQPTYSNLTFTGNTVDKVMLLAEPLTGNVTLGGAPIGFRCGFTNCPITIPTGTTLTIQPGAQVDMSNAPTYLDVQNGGSLIAEGSETQRIGIFKGGIKLQAGSQASMKYFDLEGRKGIGGIYVGIEIYTDQVQLEHAYITNAASEGIYIKTPASTTFTFNFIDVSSSGNGREGIYLEARDGSILNFNLNGGNISNNGYSGIYTYTMGGAIFPHLSNLTINANGVAPTSWAQKQGLQLSYENVNPYLENLAITNNPGTAIYWNCNGHITARNLTASGNAAEAGNQLQIAACVLTSGREWNLDGVLIPVHVTENIYINAGGVLTLAPGTRLGFDPNKRVSIQSGSLYALGSADKPIIFTRYAEGQAPWKGIENNKGTLILRHVDVSYVTDSDGVGIWGSPTRSIIQNSKIHHNYDGIYMTGTNQNTTTILNNEIYNNSHFGVSGREQVVNAYYNYWGDPSGPRHATNPGGTGDAVNQVNFNPFLTEPPEEQTLAGELWVSYGGPTMISPGETNSYAIQYLNLMDHAVEGAVAMIQLPLAATYINSNHGGVYWPARHQVFWVLGDVGVGEQALLSTQVRFDWGLPGSYTDGSIGRFAGTNYLPENLNLDEYNNFVSEGISATQMISEEDFTAMFGGNPDLNSLYNTALADGFSFKVAYSMAFDDGGLSYMAMMRTADKKSARMILLANDQASAISTDGSTYYRLENISGGMQANLLTLERTVWGSWAEPPMAPAVQATCNYARCLRNCTLKTISIELMKDTAKGIGAWLLSIPTGVGGLVGVAAGAYETAKISYDLYLCHESCNTNPLTGCCNAGDVMHSPSFIGGSSRCEMYQCNESLLSFPGAPNTIEVCGTGSRCVAGTGGQGGCKPCKEDKGFGILQSFGPQIAQAGNICDSQLFANLPSCKDLGIRVAKDPNEMFGPIGDVLPDETMGYRITYENEGAGTAYGVYIINNLPPELDASTLTIHQPSGYYLASERKIIWYIGTLGPKGDPTSSGEVTYSVGLIPGLAAGTAVVNQATVFFPSVPEETPTNSWTNMVYPLAAIPQELETSYMTPINITLAGKPAGGLGFALDMLPVGGVLSGTFPNLVYTPNEGFTGPDYFTFKVSKGGEVSQAAQVIIHVTPAGDNTPPSILWTKPDSDQIGVPFSQDPISPNDPEPVFHPIILVKFSENMKETTVSASNITVTDPDGVPLPIKVLFDSHMRQATILLLAPMNTMTPYTVSLSDSIQDLAGNALSQYEWTFITAGVKSIFLPLIIR